MILPTVTPDPEMFTTISGVKFTPLMVTLRVLPGAPAAGVTPLVDATGGMVMLNLAGALVSAVADEPEAITIVCTPTVPPSPKTAPI